MKSSSLAEMRIMNEIYYTDDSLLCTPARPTIRNCLCRKLIWLILTILLSNYSNGEHIVL